MPKQPHKDQYVLRNAEWKAFCDLNQIEHFGAATRMIIRESFNAGWVARKVADLLVTPPNKS